MGGVKVYPTYIQVRCGRNTSDGNTLDNPKIGESDTRSSDIKITTTDNFKDDRNKAEKLTGFAKYWKFGEGKTVTFEATKGKIAHIYISFAFGPTKGADHVRESDGNWGRWHDNFDDTHSNGCWDAPAGGVKSITLKGEDDFDVYWFGIDYVNDDGSITNLTGNALTFSNNDVDNNDNYTVNFGANCTYTTRKTENGEVLKSGTASSATIDRSCWVSAYKVTSVTVSSQGSESCKHVGNTITTYGTTYTRHFIQTWNVSTANGLHSDNKYYATFCHKNIMQVPSGCTAYTYTRSGNKMKPSQSIGPGLYIPASLPVIICSETTAQSQLTFTNPDGNTANTAQVSNGAKDVFCGNPNKGGLANSDTNYKYYYLMKDSRGGLNFLRYSSTTCPGHACYVRLSASAAAKGFVFEFPDDDGGTTGIGGVTAARPAYDPSAPMYNAAGQRVGASYKGIVIQNGRKFIKR